MVESHFQGFIKLPQSHRFQHLINSERNHQTFKMAAVQRGMGAVLRGVGKALDDLGCALQGRLAYRETRKLIDQTVMIVEMAVFDCALHFSLSRKS